jgi:hypothetical protein
MSRERDIALLRRFEPIIRYTKGEDFFPMDVEPYVRACSLWVQYPAKPAICLVPPGQLTLEMLARPYVDKLKAVRFLKIADPLSLTELAAYTLRTREHQAEFRAGWGRLARVGYLSRFIDAIFSITLFTRGRVPGDSAAAADLIYRRIQAENEHYRYYGRVVRQEGWVVLQYWFFYLFNNWRSSFSGTNDHEADWEMICIYLSETELGELSPQWVAYASHDHAGDDLRRHWSDPELQKEGEHPIIYAGAGSHASYYKPGEYLTELSLPFLTPFARVAERLQKFWHEQLRQYQGEKLDEREEESVANIFRIPFVDYARGDGLTIGPGQAKCWDTPGLLKPTPGWASHYRGLWGLYTRDRFAGEDAPAGPRYNRDGSIRHAWYDPVGWAGLDKVPPPNEVLGTIDTQKAALLDRQSTLQFKIESKSQKLRGLGVEAAAMRQQPHLQQNYEAHQQQIEELTAALKELRGELATTESLLEALEKYKAQILAGEPEPLRAHIQRAHHPTSENELRGSRIAEIWAAASVGLLFIGFVALALFGEQYLTFWVVAVISLFIFVEATFRNRLAQLVTNVTIGLAIFAAAIILYEFFWETIGLGVLVAGIYILLENLRELSR